MSGICGYVLEGVNEGASRDLLPAMVRELGPATPETSICMPFGNIGLGACPFPGRLAGGAEISFDGREVALVLHGSIFNTSDIVQNKTSITNIFKDILNLYIKCGMGVVKELIGEFVLAVWDGRDRSLHVAVDPFRVHPLYYCQRENIFAFASRLKALSLGGLGLSRTINPEAIVHVVAGSVIPTPKSIYREIKKLPAGHYLTWSDGTVRLTSCWEARFLETSRGGEKSLATELKSRFAHALSTRLAADVNSTGIGTFLSGGIDSSAVTGVLSALMNRPVKCFSIGFGEPKFNEIRYARIAAKAFGAEHHEYFVSPGDTCDIFPRLVETYDEPFGNASAVPTYFCARLAGEHGVDTLYAGDGGDELFAGNERYLAQRVFEYYQRVPLWMRDRVLTPLVSGVAATVGTPFLQKAGKYVRRASLPYSERIYSYDFFRIIPIGEFLEDGLIEAVGERFNPYEAIDRYYGEAPARTNLHRHLYIDWKLTLTDNDLIKVTRATELAGVTVRFPFIDRPLVEFSTRVPADLKLRGGRLRSFFKDAYKDLLPLEIREKKKHGFGLPIPVWLKTDRRLNEQMLDLVLSPRTVQRGYFRKKALEELVRRHREDETSFYGTALWNLMALEMWLRQTSQE